MTSAIDTARIPGAGDAGAAARWTRGAALVAALFAFATAWNLTKAYHIDDPVYIDMAQWIAAHPLHPMQGMVFWFEEGPASVVAVNQPHLYLYAMAGWGSIFGWNEIPMHALMALATLACIVLMYRLARAVLPEMAPLATVLVGAGPAFVVGQNTMIDIPALALCLLFFVILLEARQQSGPERIRYVLAGLVCGAAILTKYTSLVLFPALILDGWLRRRREAAYGVAAAAAIVLLWCGFNYWDYGGIHMLTRMDAQGFTNVLDPRKWILCLGASAPATFALAGAWLASRKRSLPRLAFALLALGVAVFLALVVALSLGFFDAGVSTAVFATFFLASGSLLCGLALLALPRPFATPDTGTIAHWLLAYWAAGGAAFIILLAPFVAMRHVLFALPAFVLLALAALRGRMGPGWATVALVTTFLSTSVVASADRWYAGIYRDEARRLRESLPASARVWTIGHWGWQWYAQRNGMNEILPGNSHPAVGDFIVYPERVHSQPLPADIALTVVREVAVAPTNWIRAFAAPNAGFYATTEFTQLPWAVRRGPIDIFRVLRVDAVHAP